MGYRQCQRSGRRGIKMGTAARTVCTIILGMLVGAALVVGYLETHPALFAPASSSSAPVAVRATGPVAPAAIVPAGDNRRPAFEDEDLLADLYERVSPAVVNITVRSQRSGGGNQPEFEQGTGSGNIPGTHRNNPPNKHPVGEGTPGEGTPAGGPKPPPPGRGPGPPS